MTSVTAIPITKGAGLRRDADHSLIERALGGDRDAFAQLVAAHRPYVARLVRRLLGWDVSGDDVVQEVFVRLWMKRSRVREPEKLRGWLAAVAVNAARQHLRREKVRKLMLLNAGRHRRAERDTSADVSEPMEREELGRRVREAVNALPQRDKEVLVLRYLEQMAVDEVAGVLGLRVNAVQVRLHRARKRLAEHLPQELRS